MYPMNNHGQYGQPDWEIYEHTLYCTEFDNETWGRHILETGQIFCSQCGRTDHKTA